MDKIKLHSSNWKVKQIDRSRGRMKINIKLSKEESEGFKNWSTMVRPEGVNDEDFCKQIFFNGIEYLNFKLQEISMKILNDPELRKNLEASGINVSAIENSLPKQ